MGRKTHPDKKGHKKQASAPKNLRPFMVDFNACISEGVSVHMSKTVQAEDKDDAIETCHVLVAKEYGRTPWCTKFEALKVEAL